MRSQACSVIYDPNDEDLARSRKLGLRPLAMSVRRRPDNSSLRTGRLSESLAERALNQP